jgi:hypothetical protein
VEYVLDKSWDWADYPAMCRKVIATLLIAGWIILSGFDVLEDLEFPGGVAVSRLSHDPSSTPTVAGWGALANNIVESAYRIQQASFDLVGSTTLTLDLDSVPDFRAYFQLHKLYHVFLI